MPVSFDLSGRGWTSVAAGSGIYMTLDQEHVRKMLKMYDTLGTRLVNKIIKRETRPLSKKITEAAKANAPVKTGKLRKAIKTRVIKNAKGSRLKIVGTATFIGEGFFKGETFYGSFQEFGWHVGKRTRGKADAARKFIKGKHYMKKAAEDLGPEMLQRAAYAISKALNVEADKLAKQNREKLLASVGIKGI